MHEAALLKSYPSGPELLPSLFISFIWGGPHKMELSSGRWGPYSIGFPHKVNIWEPICIRVPTGIVVKACVQLQWNSFEDSFNAFAYFMMDDLWAHLPTPCRVFSRFWPKMSWPPGPTLFIHLIIPRGVFCLFPWIKKGLKGKHFADVEEEKLFWAVGKNASIGALHQMESTLKVNKI